MNYTTILYQEDDHIGHIILNRPKCINALNKAMIDELEHLFQVLEKKGFVQDSI
jgi:enoyl-CoA hydratase/carnithine racemase